MKTGPGKKSYQAFTLTELLVILAILAVLACIQVSALSVSKDQTRIAQCSGNLKQIAMSLQLYGADNSDKLPQGTASNGSWPWDLTWSTGMALTRYGAPWQTLYCPGTAARFTAQDYWNLYNYQPGNIHVVGYTLAIAGSSSILYPTNVNTSLTAPSLIISGPLGNAVVPVTPSKRVLVADATISGANQYTYSARYSYNWTSILGGYSKPHLSPHLNGQLPAGGNVVMIDGHLEWRRFDDMQCRVTGFTGTPGFWW